MTPTHWSKWFHSSKNMSPHTEKSIAKLYSSIHLFPFYSPYLGAGHSVCKLRRVSQMSLSPAVLSSCSWGWDIQSLQGVLGLVQGLLPVARVEPSQLTPFQWLHSFKFSSDVWASRPVSKAEPSHPTVKTHLGRLYPRSYSFESPIKAHGQM